MKSILALPLVSLFVAELVTVSVGFQIRPSLASPWNDISRFGPRTTTLTTRDLSSVGQVLRCRTTSLFAAKKKKKAKKGGGSSYSSSKGGGFGASKVSSNQSSSSSLTVSADKNALERQWDVFTQITDLEIFPKGDPEDEDYQHFEVVDVFVRCGKSSSSSSDDDAKNTNTKGGGTGWFRIGKVCAAAEDATIPSALALQKGLIFWTAVHMRRELVAAGGKSGAAQLELGFVSPPTMYMGSESDGPLDDEEAEDVQIATTTTTTTTGGVNSVLKGVKSNKCFGFRPDWNPPGFTYKRREKAAMKKKKTNLEAIEEIAT